MKHSIFVFKLTIAPSWHRKDVEFKRYIIFVAKKITVKKVKKIILPSRFIGF